MNINVYFNNSTKFIIDYTCIYQCVGNSIQNRCTVLNLHVYLMLLFTLALCHNYEKFSWIWVTYYQPTDSLYESSRFKICKYSNLSCFYIKFFKTKFIWSFTIIAWLNKGLAIEMKKKCTILGSPITCDGIYNFLSINVCVNFIPSPTWALG